MKLLSLFGPANVRLPERVRLACTHTHTHTHTHTLSLSLSLSLTHTHTHIPFPNEQSAEAMSLRCCNRHKVRYNTKQSTRYARACNQPGRIVHVGERAFHLRQARQEFSHRPVTAERRDRTGQNERGRVTVPATRSFLPISHQNSDCH